jgi:plastocyanin
MNAIHRLALVAGIFLGCSDRGTGPSCGSGNTATAVNVCDNLFAPASSPITTGATITWTWRGGNQHNVTFEDGQGSSTTKTSGTHSRTFSGVGTFRYRCTIHSTNFSTGMVGSVSVQ